MLAPRQPSRMEMLGGENAHIVFLGLSPESNRAYAQNLLTEQRDESKIQWIKATFRVTKPIAKQAFQKLTDVDEIIRKVNSLGDEEQGVFERELATFVSIFRSNQIIKRAFTKTPKADKVKMIDYSAIKAPSFDEKTNMYAYLVRCKRCGNYYIQYSSSPNFEEVEFQCTVCDFLEKAKYLPGVLRVS